MMPVPRPQTLSEAFIAYKQQKSTAPKELLGESEIIQALQDLSPENRKNLFKVLLCFLTCESFWAPNPTDTLIRQIYDAAIAALPGTPEERNRIINECRAHFPSALAEPLSERAFNVIVHRAVPITSAWRPSFTSPLTHGTPTYVPQASEEDEETFLSHFQQYMSASDRQSPSLLPELESYLVQALDPEQPLSLFARFPSEIARTIFFMIPLDERDPVENPIVQLRFVCHFFDAMLKRLIPLGQEDELSLALMQKICREIPETSVIGNVRDIAPTIQMGAMPLPEPHASYAGSRVIKQIWRYHNVSRNWLERRVGDPINPQAFLQKTIQMLYPIPETATPEMRAEIEAFHAALLTEYHRRSYWATHRDTRCLFTSEFAEEDEMKAVCGALLRSDRHVEAIYLSRNRNEHLLTDTIALSEKPIFVVGASENFYHYSLPAAYLKRLHVSLLLTHHDLPRPFDFDPNASITIGSRPNGTKTITGLGLNSLRYQDQTAEAAIDFLCSALGSEQCDIVELTLTMPEEPCCDSPKLLVLARAINASEARRGVQIILRGEANAQLSVMKLRDYLEQLAPSRNEIVSVKLESRHGQPVVITGMEFNRLGPQATDFLCAALSARGVQIILSNGVAAQPNDYRQLVNLYEHLKRLAPFGDEVTAIKLENRRGQKFAITGIEFDSPSDQGVKFLCALLGSEQCDIVDITISFASGCSENAKQALAGAINESEARRKVQIVLRGDEGIRLNGYRHLMKLCEQLRQRIPDWDSEISVKLENRRGQQIVTGMEFKSLGDHEVDFLCAAFDSEECAIVDVTIQNSIYGHVYYSSFSGEIRPDPDRDARAEGQAKEKLARAVNANEARRGAPIVLRGDEGVRINGYRHLLKLCDQIKLPMPDWNSITSVTLENRQGQQVVTGVEFKRLSDNYFEGNIYFLCELLGNERCDIVDITISGAVDCSENAKQALARAINQNEVRRKTPIVLHGDGGGQIEACRQRPIGVDQHSAGSSGLFSQRGQPSVDGTQVEKRPAGILVV